MCKECSIEDSSKNQACCPYWLICFCTSNCCLTHRESVHSYLRLWISMQVVSEVINCLLSAETASDLLKSLAKDSLGMDFKGYNLTDSCQLGVDGAVLGLPLGIQYHLGLTRFDFLPM